MNEEPSPTPGIWSCDRPLAQYYDLAVVDLDGVVYVGPDVVPGAADAIADARRAGMGICYLTNNASRSAQAVAEHLRRLSVPAEVADVLTSAQVGAGMLARRLPAGARVLVVGGEGLAAALQEVGLVPVAGMDEHPVAVAQGFAPDLGYRLLAEGTRAVRAGLPWLATNLDLTLPTPHGPAPGNGALVALVATAAGRRPDLVAGKPQPEPFLDAARRRAAQRPLVIGDRLDTDLEGANAAGMPGMAVMTGVSTVHDLVSAPPAQRPRYLAADLSGLVQAHPPVAVSTTGPVTAHCRGFTVGVQDIEAQDRDGGADAAPAAPVLRVRGKGEHPIDLVRAACAAAWAWSDLQRPGSQPEPVATHEVSEVCARLGARWAR